MWGPRVGISTNQHEGNLFTGRQAPPDASPTKAKDLKTLNAYVTFLGRTNVRSLWTAAGISCTGVLPKPKMNPCCAAFPR